MTKRFKSIATVAAATMAVGLFTTASYAAPDFASDFGDWNGVYIGANAGGGMANSTITDYQNWILNYTGGDLSQSGWGALAGGTIGYNKQFGHFVFGLEGDMQWANLNADRTLNPGPEVEIKGDLDWFATVRARAGLAEGPVLAYVTGGIAIGSPKYNYGWINYSPLPDPSYHASKSETQVGLAAGAGVEYAFARQWSAKFEYMYLGFPSVSETFTSGLPANYDFKSSYQIIRAGLNYRF